MKTLLLKNKQILFFILAGAMSACIEIGVFKGLSVVLPKVFDWEKSLGGLHFPLSNVGSTFCGIISNYYFSIWFVFSRGKHSKRREFVYFIFISALTTLMSLVLFQVFYTYLFRGNVLDVGFFIFSGEILSKFFAIGTTSVLNYFIKKKFIFN